MSKIDQFRLTDEERQRPYYYFGSKLWCQAIADAATDKALRQVVAWLRESTTVASTSGEIADRLAAMLEGPHS